VSTTRTDPFAALYPEVGAGGFTRVDGTVEFYARVNALLRPTDIVLEFGAGRGRSSEDVVAFRRDLTRLRGKVREVIGLDVDDAVLENPLVDRALVYAVGGPFPLADASVDKVVSDFTFEHVTDPNGVARELDRVLRPGGWLCARTPNRSGYIAVAGRLVPNRFHHRVLQRAQSHGPRAEHDVFPTAYRMNTLREVGRLFPGYRDCSYSFDAEPAYFGTSRLAIGVARTLVRVVPERFGSMLHLFLQKPG
jgi:SAM-dependent methyltransferase